MREHYRAFGSLFFLLHQGKLLWLLNAPVIGRWFRHVLRISGESSAVGTRRITRILPHAIFWWQGDKQVAEFRTHAKFSKRLYYAFAPLWWAMHGWDWCVADRWVPQLSFGFDTLTAYPDEGSPGTYTIDGRIRQTYGAGAGQTWATIRAAAGSSTTQEATSRVIHAASDTGSNNFTELARFFHLYKTDGLTASANISAAVVSLKGTSTKADTLVATPVSVIVSCAPASNTVLDAGDFDSVGSTALSGTIAYADWSNTAYNDFTLNAGGIAAISKDGITKFATIEDTYDRAGGTCPWLASKSYYTLCFSADQTGTADDPKLVVTYTLPASAVSGRIVWESRSDGTIGA